MAAASRDKNPTPLTTSAAGRARLPALTDRLRLGASGLSVSPVCLGLVGSADVLTTAFEAGINFFFVTADMHWPLYEPVREGLRRLLRSQVREKIAVAVVSYMTQPEFCFAPFEEVLEAVPELGHIDVGVIGGAYATDFPIRLREYAQRRPGDMRALGATFHERAAAVNAINEGELDIAFIRYNSSHAGAESEVFPHLRSDRVTKVFNFQSTHGHLDADRLAELGLPTKNWRPTPADHYRFALTSPYLDGLLCALQDGAQVDDLRQALAKGPLSADEADYLKKLSALAKGKIVLVDR
jgi:hypothetical protein